jgi:hypothetical protein
VGGGLRVVGGVQRVVGVKRDVPREKEGSPHHGRAGQGRAAIDSCEHQQMQPFLPCDAWPNTSWARHVLSSCPSYLPACWPRAK